MGIVFTTLDLLLSYIFNLYSGATIVMILAVVFLIHTTLMIKYK
ncbi:hypothetical protein [Methanobacterium spitsbergense]